MCSSRSKPGTCLARLDRLGRRVLRQQHSPGACLVEQGTVVELPGRASSPFSTGSPRGAAKTRGKSVDVVCHLTAVAMEGYKTEREIVQKGTDLMLLKHDLRPSRKRFYSGEERAVFK